MPKPTVTEQRQGKLDAAEQGLTTTKEALQGLLDDLEEKRDNLEESFSGTARYDRFVDACDTVQALIDEVEGIDLMVELP